MPSILVVQEPTELIVIDGEPTFTPFPGNELLYVSNSESDVLMEIASQQYYVVLAGRWFRSSSLNGEWSWVASDELPASFAKIPPGSDKEHLRVYVAQTQEAEDAVVEAQIPQTAAVSRSEAHLEVDYDGEPKFEPVEGVEQMDYAVNTSSSVLKIGELYYSCEQGVWFKSVSAQGPWELADSVPQQVQSIPPSNPNYNVKYVHVYESTPQVVYVGYTPAYLGCYPYHGAVVYGTGYYYRPWISPYHYYPRSWTFGFSVRYNPWTGGWGFGFSAGYGGFSFSFGWGSGWYGSPWMGPRPGFWGPAGYRAGYHHGFRAGYWAGRRSGSRPVNLPGRRPGIHPPASRPGLDRPATRDRAAMRDNLYNRPENRARNAPTDRAAQRDRSLAPANRDNLQNNVFSDRDGNVYRRGDNGWERRDSSGWKRDGGGAAARPAAPTQRPSTRETAPSRPSVSNRPTPSTRPVSPSRPASPSRLDRDYNARQRGSSRTQNYNRSRGTSGGSRGGGEARSAQGWSPQKVAPLFVVVFLGDELELVRLVDQLLSESIRKFFVPHQVDADSDHISGMTASHLASCLLVVLADNMPK